MNTIKHIVKMSWEDEEYVCVVPEVVNTMPVVEVPKTLEDLSFEKKLERALEKKAVLEQQLASAKAALEKARAEAKNTAASKAYVASFEKKVAAAEADVVQANKDILIMNGKECKRQAAIRNAKNGVKEFNYERDVLGVVWKNGKMYIPEGYND